MGKINKKAAGQDGKMPKPFRLKKSKLICFKSSIARWQVAKKFHGVSLEINREKINLDFHIIQLCNSVISNLHCALLSLQLQLQSDFRNQVSTI